MNNYTKLLPFYIPIINLVTFIFKSEARIDVVIEFVFFLISLYYLFTGKKKSGFVTLLLIFSSFIFLHTIYSYVNFPHIFSTVLTVNFQLLLIIFLIIFYNLFPLTSSQIRKAITAINIFGISILFFQFLSFLGISIINSQEISSESTRHFGIIGDQEAWLFSLFSFINFKNNSYFISIIFFIGLLLTGSIGAAVIVVLGVVLKLYLEFSKIFRLIYIGIISLMLPLMLKVAPYLNIPFVNRLYENALSDGGALGHRTAAFENGLSEILKKLVLGFGNFSAEMIYQYDDSLSIYEKGKLTYLATSNNQIFDILLSYGFVGLVFFFIFIVAILKYIKPFDYNFMFTRLFYLWFFIFLIFNQSSIWFIPGSYIFLILVLLISINTSYNEYFITGNTKNIIV